MGIGIDNSTMEKLKQLQEMQAKTASQGGNSGVQTDYDKAMGDNGSVFNLVGNSGKVASQGQDTSDIQLVDLGNMNKNGVNQNKLQSIDVGGEDSYADFDVDSIDTDGMQANADNFLAGNDARIANAQKATAESDAAGLAINAQTSSAAQAVGKSDDATAKMETLINQNVAKINQADKKRTQNEKVANQKNQANEKLDAENTKLNKEIDTLVEQANSGSDGVGEKSVYNLKTAGSIQAEKEPQQAQNKNDQSKGSGMIGTSAKTASQNSTLITGNKNDKPAQADNQPSRANTGDTGIDAQIRQKEAKIASNNQTKTVNTNAAKVASNNATKASKEINNTKTNSSTQIANTQEEIAVGEEENTLNDTLAKAEEEAIAERIEGLENEKSTVSMGSSLFMTMGTAGDIMVTVGNAKIKAGEAQEVKGKGEETAGKAQETAGEAQKATGETEKTEGEALSNNPYTLAAGLALMASGAGNVMSGIGQITEGKAMQAQGKEDIAAGNVMKGEGEVTVGKGETLKGISSIGMTATTAATIGLSAEEAAISGDAKYAAEAMTQTATLAGNVAKDFASTYEAKENIDEAGGNKGNDKTNTDDNNNKKNVK